MTAANAAAPPLFESLPGDTALLISMPHSGTHVPGELAERMTPAAREVPDTDWFIPELYDFHGEIGAGVVRATHSRYVVDLNRPADGAPLYPGQRETTVCPTESFDGEPLYLHGEDPAPAEIETRLARYWRPYHDELERRIAATVQRHGRCLLWDAHSIHSRVPALFEGRLPDLNVGTADGRSAGPALVARIAGFIAEQRRFDFVVNGRFKGGFITRHYGRPGDGVDAVQLEIAQAAYLQEERLPSFDAARARPLAQLLRDLLRLIG